ncbi:hypothetical protein ABIA16_003404 [Sinorhizobium fredii]
MRRRKSNEPQKFSWYYIGLHSTPCQPKPIHCYLLRKGADFFAFGVKKER